MAYAGLQHYQPNTHFFLQKDLHFVKSEGHTLHQVALKPKLLHFTKLNLFLFY
jgi:hypothetical protein